MVRLRFPVKIENRKKKKENKSNEITQKLYISNVSKVAIDTKTKKREEKKRKEKRRETRLLHESDRFKGKKEKKEERDRGLDRDTKRNGGC